MILHVSKNTNDLSASVAEHIKNAIATKLETADRFTLVLSGGSTPKLLFSILAQEPYKSEINWEKVHFFWGDERFVPFEDDRNNAKMAYDTLLNQVGVKAENIHVMRTDLSPEESTAQYESTLKSYFGEEEVTFDIVLLGMGDDGHTLSLFPGTDVIHESSAWVYSFFLTAQDMYRITLTAPVVNKAKEVIFLAAGANKATVLKEVLEGEKNFDVYPSQIIQPINGTLHWYVDEAATALLSTK